MSLQYPLIQGRRHSWSSIEARANNAIVLGFTEINYSFGLEPGEVRGAGPWVVGHTLGEVTLEGDFTILLEEYNQLIQSLGPDFMTKTFDIVVTYDESGGGLSTIVDTLIGVRITKVEAANAIGTDGSARKCTIKYLNFLDNGRTFAPVQQTLPQ